MTNNLCDTEQVKTRCEEYFNSLNCKESLPTIYDLAAWIGVSYGTIKGWAQDNEHENNAVVMVAFKQIAAIRIAVEKAGRLDSTWNAAVLNNMF